MAEGLSAIYAYSPQIIVFGICAILLEYPSTPILHIVTGSIFIWIWSYFAHRIVHNVPEKFTHLFPHVSIHHKHTIVFNRFIDLLIEAIADFGIFIPVYVMQYLIDIQIVPNYVIFLSALMYISIHIIHFSILKQSEKHSNHHANPGVNFGPDYLDHIFGTNSDNEYENSIYTIPYIVASYLLLKNI